MPVSRFGQSITSYTPATYAEVPEFTSEPTAILTVGDLEEVVLTATGMPLPLITLDETLSDELPNDLIFTLIVQTVEDIGAEGGTVTSNNGDIVIGIPVDAVAGNTTFTFIPQAEPTQGTGSFASAGTSFQLTAEDNLGNPIYTFTEPLIITITYDPDALGEIDPQTLRLYYWDAESGDEGEWKDAFCEGKGYDDYIRGEHYFTLPICHLSEFAVLGEAGTGYQIFLPLIFR